MRKDITIGIIFGIGFGLLIAFGFWRVNSAYQSKNNETLEEKKDISQNLDPSEELSISLAGPENLDVVSTNPTLFSGITKPNAKVVISSEEKDYIINAGNDGAFEQNVDLIGGVNQILISAFDEKGKKIEKTIIIVYSTEL